MSQYLFITKSLVIRPALSGRYFSASMHTWVYDLVSKDKLNTFKTPKEG